MHYVVWLELPGLQLRNTLSCLCLVLIPSCTNFQLNISYEDTSTSILRTHKAASSIYTTSYKLTVNIHNNNNGRISVYSATSISSWKFTTLCGGFLLARLNLTVNFFERKTCDSPQIWKQSKTKTPGATFLTLRERCVGSLTFAVNQYRENAGDGAWGVSSLPRKTTMSNHLWISQQKQHILPNYLKL